MIKTLWNNVVEKWKTMPTESPLPRLENHLTHMFGGCMIVYTVMVVFGGSWLFGGLIVTILSIIREIIQVKNQRQVIWVAAFDVWQYHFHFVLYFLYLERYLQFGIVFIFYFVVYFIFLLNDNKWFDEYIKKKIHS